MDSVDSTATEKYFKTYFQYLSVFSWDKAKEFVEKEKQPLIPTSLLVRIIIYRSIVYSI